MKQAFVNSHAIFRGESFRTERASYGLLVILVNLSVLMNVGILSATDPAVSWKYPEITGGREGGHITPHQWTAITHLYY